MDFGLLPPEVNSSRMYSGPGPESMLAAAAAWDGVAAELTSAAVSYGSVVSTLIVEPWMGPAAMPAGWASAGPGASAESAVTLTGAPVGTAAPAVSYGVAAAPAAKAAQP